MDYNQSNQFPYYMQDEEVPYSAWGGQDGWHGMPYYRQPQAPYRQPEIYMQSPMAYGQPNMMPSQPRMQAPIPYHMAYPAPMYMQGEEEDERDLEKLQSMFPKTAKLIQPMVEDACDRMEYDGSLMFDEYPDKLMMERLIEQIYQNIQNSQDEEQMQGEEGDDIFAAACRGRGCNGNRFGDGVQDLISVMLFGEMHRRRCRRRRCKRWW